MRTQTCLEGRKIVVQVGIKTGTCRREIVIKAHSRKMRMVITSCDGQQAGKYFSTRAASSMQLAEVACNNQRWSAGRQADISV